MAYEVNDFLKLYAPSPRNKDSTKAYRAAACCFWVRVCLVFTLWNAETTSTVLDYEILIFQSWS